MPTKLCPVEQREAEQATREDILADADKVDIFDGDAALRKLGVDPKPEYPDAEGDDRRIARWIVGLLNGVGYLGLIGWSASTCASWLSVLSSGTLLGCASFCCGALLGLLFGMPRGPSTKGEGTNLENTNLVQISDWLTKALVGAGLTQAHNLGEVLTRIGSTYADELHSRGVAIALVIYYGIAGFFSGWLITRFFVEGMLHRLRKRTSSDGPDPNAKISRNKAKPATKKKPKGPPKQASRESHA